MKILFLPKHEYMGASSRYRTLQYLTYFRNENIDFDINPLFSDEYLKYKYENGKENKLITIKRILNRVKTIFFTASQYDMLVFEKELLPYFPPFLELYLKMRKIPYIIDYDDAVWHNYDMHKQWFVRSLFKNKFSYIISNAKGVIVGSHYLQEYILNYINNVVLIPTSIEINKYKLKKDFSSTKTIIGWIGSPSSSQYVMSLNAVLEELCEKIDAEVHLIGFDEREKEFLSFPYKLIEWKEETEVDNLIKFDIGIMPLFDSVFERGKCGFKLVQYMGCGLPVVASNIGENKYIINDSNGFLVNRTEDWLKYIEKLSKDKSLQKSHGQSGRRKIEDDYSTENNFKKYVEFIRENI